MARVYQRLDEGTPKDLETVRSVLAKLLVSNAASADQWSTLGALLVKTGDIEKGRYCYMRAGQLAPRSVETDLAIANFYIDLHDPRNAIPYLGRILDKTSEYNDTVFADFDALKQDFGEVLANGGMPDQRRPLQSYFEHLLGTGDVGNARKAWVRLKRYSPDDKLADLYVNFLVTKGLPEEGRAVWADQTREAERGGGKWPLVSNGDFEKEPSGAFFDWRISPREHVTGSRDQKVYHSGHASLRIDFDGGENMEYQGVSQRVLLSPGTYRLEAFARTKAITTDEGVALRVLNAQTEKAIGTTNWRRLQATFVVSALRVVEIQVVRHSSLRFDSKIAGSVWIDDVSLGRVR